MKGPSDAYPPLIARLLLAAGFVLTVVPTSRGLCETVATPIDAPAVPGRPSAARRIGGLEHRVQLLTQELKLNTDQQRRIRLLLTQQRDEVRRIWTDGAVPPAERAPATRATNERVGEEIRALLNDEQKKKYNSVKPPTDRAQGERRSVDQWLDSGVAR